MRTTPDLLDTKPVRAGPEQPGYVLTDTGRGNRVAGNRPSASAPGGSGSFNTALVFQPALGA